VLFKREYLETTTTEERKSLKSGGAKGTFSRTEKTRKGKTQKKEVNPGSV